MRIKKLFHMFWLLVIYLPVFNEKLWVRLTNYFDFAFWIAGIIDLFKRTLFFVCFFILSNIFLKERKKSAQMSHSLTKLPIFPYLLKISMYIDKTLKAWWTQQIKHLYGHHVQVRSKEHRIVVEVNLSSAMLTMCTILLYFHAHCSYLLLVNKLIGNNWKEFLYYVWIISVAQVNRHLIHSITTALAINDKQAWYFFYLYGTIIK